MPSPIFADFVKRCSEDYEAYPTNLIYRTEYLRTLEQYREKLLKNKERLCSEERYLDVGFRDFDNRYTIGKNAWNVQDMDTLEKRLGKSVMLAPQDEKGGVDTLFDYDPQCRFIFFWADNSRRNLRVSYEALLKILTFHQVNPSYLEFIMSFGRRRDDRGNIFSRFRTHYYLGEHPEIPEMIANGMPNGGSSKLQTTPALPELGRSGRCFQLAWSLKTVVNRASPKEINPEWYTRSVGIYHQFDVENGRTLWITTSGREDIQLRVEDLTGRNARRDSITYDTPESSFRQSFCTHLLFCQWATEGWADYLHYLEETVEEKTYMALDGDCEPGDRDIKYTSSDLQDIQRREDRVHAALTLLEANAETINSMRNFYLLLKNDSLPLYDACAASMTVFTSQLAGYVADLGLLARRARSLVTVTSSRRTLVVQHLQSQAAEEMSGLAKAAQRETIAMRIIAFITVIYLPASLVTALFSTDIVGYQNQGNAPVSNFKFSKEAMIKWAQISIPLTFLTLLCVGVWYFWDRGITRPRWGSKRTKLPGRRWLRRLCRFSRKRIFA